MASHPPAHRAGIINPSIASRCDGFFEIAEEDSPVFVDPRSGIVICARTAAADGKIDSELLPFSSCASRFIYSSLRRLLAAKEE